MEPTKDTELLASVLSTKSNESEAKQQEANNEKNNIYFKEDDGSSDKSGCCCCGNDKSCCLIEFFKQFFSFIIFVVFFIPVLLLIYIYCLLVGLISRYCCCCCKYGETIKNEMIRYGSFRYWMVNKVMRTCYPYWWLFTNTPILKDYTNLLLISILLKMYIKKVGNLPRMNLNSDYTTYDVVEDCGHSTYARHLPRDSKYTSSLPDIDKVIGLFMRKEFVAETNRNASVTLAYWAQWLTHQFFNTKQSNNESNGHQHVNQPVGFNLSQLYGSTSETINRLRAKRGGLMRSTWIHGKEWPPLIEISKDTTNDPVMTPIFEKLNQFGKQKFDIPIELANMVPGFLAIHVIWFRHHQYIARSMANKYPDWDDNKLFEISRMINILCCMRVTCNDYINHGINTAMVKIRFDQYSIENLISSKVFRLINPLFVPIYGTSFEFNLLYRFHQFIPDSQKYIKNFDPNTTAKTRDMKDDLSKYECNEVQIVDNSAEILLSDKYNLESLLRSSTLDHAGKLTLLNTNEWLTNHVIKLGFLKQRKFELTSYNNYRKHFGFKPYTKFEEICTNENVVNALKSVYKRVDDIEYYVGLFAENKDMKGLGGPFLIFFIGAMAYTGILSTKFMHNNWNNIITKFGCTIVNDVTDFDSVVSLHSDLPKGSVSFDSKDSTNGASLVSQSNADQMSVEIENAKNE